MFIISILINTEKVARSTAEAFAVFYEQYLPKIFRYISYRITDKSLAEDLTSTVFEKALTKFKSYSAEKASFATWIFRIARNTLIDHFRVNSKAQTVQLDDSCEIQSKDLSPEERIIAEEQRQVLQKCLSTLSLQEQEIISLKFGAEMNNRQIAGMLGLTDSNVGVILYRAVRKLRTNFEGWNDG